MLVENVLASTSLPMLKGPWCFSVSSNDVTNLHNFRPTERPTTPEMQANAVMKLVLLSPGRDRKVGTPSVLPEGTCRGIWLQGKSTPTSSSGKGEGWLCVGPHSGPVCLPL
jgi:hypothetical protein